MEDCIGDMMLKKAKPIEINPENIFANDMLDRERIIINLTEIIKNAEEGFVLCVNAPWGNGKTTFINLWKAYLEKENFKTIYFNAWENDYSKEPLLSILNVLSTELKEKEEGAFNKVKQAGFKLLKAGLPIAVRAATMGIINFNELKDAMSDETDAAIAELTAKAVENKMNELAADKGIHEQFRAALTEYTKEAVDGNGQNKLIFFIDELDRCRPIYAVELLEAVKHFFSVENIVFVLSVDKKQLGDSIKTMYGMDMDTEGYLKRFFDISFSLPLPSRKRYIDYLYKVYEFKKFFENRQGYEGRQYEESHIVDTIKFLSDLWDLSLREVDHIFLTLSTAFIMTDKNKKLFPQFFAFLIILKQKEPDYYYRLSNDLSCINEVTALLENAAKNKKMDSHIVRLLDVFINVGCRNEEDCNVWLEELKQNEDYIQGDYWARGRVDIASGLMSHFDDGAIDSYRYIFNKIEFLENVDWSER
ncbi:MAG TPA: NTPase [Bacteroidales bacterium]|nr:NTPase [Bacteroidales bacterium]